MADDIRIADLVASVSLDVSGLEAGTVKAEDELRRLEARYDAQRAALRETARNLDEYNAGLEHLRQQVAALSEEERNSPQGQELARRFAEGADASDQMAASYRVLKQAADNTADAILNLQAQIGMEANAVADAAVETEDLSEQQAALRDQIRATRTDLSAMSAGVTTVGRALGVDSQLLSAITRSIALYKRGVQDAAMADQAHAAAIAAKNAMITMGVSILILVISKLIEYAAAQAEATKETETAADKVARLAEDYDSFTESLEKSRKASEADIRVLDPLIDRYDKLNSKTALTASEKNQLARVVAELQRAYGDLGWELDTITGKWNVTTAAIKDNRQAMLDNIAAQYEYDKAAEAYATKQTVLAELGLTNEKDIETRYNRALRKTQEYQNILDTYYGTPFHIAWDPLGYADAKKGWEKALAEENKYGEALEQVAKANIVLLDYKKLAAGGGNSGATSGTSTSGGGGKTTNPSETNLVKLADGVVKALKNKYQTALDDEKDALNQSIRAWKEWEEQNVAAIKGQIAALDELEAKEDAEQRAADLKRKADELAYRLRFESDATARAELQKQLNAANAAYDKEIARQERAALKASLSAQIETVQHIAALQTEALQGNVSAAEAAYKVKTDTIALNAEAQKWLTAKKGSTLSDLLSAYNPEYYLTGAGEAAYAALGSTAATSLYNTVQKAAKDALTSAAAESNKSAAAYLGGAAGGKSVTIETINFNGNLGGSPTELRAEMDRFADYLANLLS